MPLILAAWNLNRAQRAKVPLLMPPDSLGVFVKQELHVENPQEADFHTLTIHFIFLSLREIQPPCITAHEDRMLVCHHAREAISNKFTRRILYEN
jgi:hypothetical protein